MDASFTRARWRVGLVEVARRWAVPVRIFRCVTDDAVARARLRARVGDASEADEAVYDRVPWEPEDDTVVVDVDRNGPVEAGVATAAAALESAGVLGTPGAPSGLVGSSPRRP